MSLNHVHSAVDILDVSHETFASHYRSKHAQFITNQLTATPLNAGTSNGPGAPKQSESQRRTH
jgi:hypothetical protein